jgi:hypothetical protein
MPTVKAMERVGIILERSHLNIVRKIKIIGFKKQSVANERKRRKINKTAIFYL